MKNTSTLFSFFLLLFFVSCEDESALLPNGDEITGTWQVYERGYSPGSGYIIEEVSEEPSQTLQFMKGNLFASNYSQLKDYKYFFVLDNPRYSGRVLALFKKKPVVEDMEDVDKLSHSYSIDFENGNLKLSYRFCTEGCHIGLKRIKGD